MTLTADPETGQPRTLRVSVTQSLQIDYHVDGDQFDGNVAQRYWDLKNRTDLLLMQGGITFNLRLDGNAFFDTPDNYLRTPEGLAHKDHLTLEKISLASIQRQFDITAGDAYLRLGRGLALDLTRDVFRDTTLRGAQLRARLGRVSALLFGGWINPLEVDDATELPIRAPDDVLFGGQLEAQPLGGLTLSAHYVGSSLESQTVGATDQTHIVGGSLTLPPLAGRVNAYGEFDYFYRDYQNARPDGMGAYGMVTSSLGPLALLLELRFYQALQFSQQMGPEEHNKLTYNRPPTLSRSKVEILKNDDVFGPRLRADLRVGPLGTVIYGSYGWLYNSDGTLDTGFFDTGGPGHDLFGGLQQPLPDGSLELSGGYRDETRGAGHHIQAFAEAELSLTLAKRHTIDLQSEYRSITKLVKTYSDFFFTLGYRPSVYGAGAITYEYSTEFLEAAPEGATPRSHFVSFTGTVNFTSTSFARFFLGTTRGGSRCVDGICRTVPAFYGGKVEIVVQL